MLDACRAFYNALSCIAVQKRESHRPTLLHHLVAIAPPTLLEYRHPNTGLLYTSVMLRTELIARLASHFPALTVKDAEAVVSVIVTAMIDRLADGAGGRVEIRGFGAFTTNYRPPRIGRNPKTAEPVPVPAKFVPHFKPGRELRTRVAAAAQGEKHSAPAKAKDMAHEQG
jgi:integration host factor subunit beta